MMQAPLNHRHAQPHTTNASARPHHHRARSSSDPFIDPVYHAPNLSYEKAHSRSVPPAPPPKPPKKTTAMREPRDQRPLESAVRDAVTVRNANDQSPRNHMNRSKTGVTPPSSRNAAAPTSRRSYSQDSGNAVTEKARRAGKTGKKNSVHADVIDALDFTGNGPIFHHDSPFDACAPSRNRHKAKAPMFAWSGQEDDAPASAAQHRADRRPAAVDNFRSAGDSPYPPFDSTAAVYAKAKDPKQVDRIAEAWGIHEPEPYEEFFGAGGDGGDASAASSIRGATDPQGQKVRRGYELRETYADNSKPPPARRQLSRAMPPPQPINLPGAPRTSQDGQTSPGLASSPGAPKRSKSLMQKIRKMRDAPNIPVDAPATNGDDPSPPSSVENYNGTDGARQGRPVHRHQNSFFGRFGRNTSSNGQLSPSDPDDQFVYVEKTRNSNKALPPRPMDTPLTPVVPNRDGYFDDGQAPYGAPTSPGAGLGRKTSLMRKVKGVVKNGK